MAGSGGLSREISWVYFADTVDMRDCITWVDTGYLCVSTGKNLNGRMDELCRELPRFNEKNIAGILFNTGGFITEIPENVKECADALELPIFTLPWESKLVDVTRQLCNYIVKSEQENSLHSSFLTRLLFDKDTDEAAAAQLALGTGFDFARPCRIYYLKYFLPEELRRRAGSDPNFIIGLRRRLHALVQERSETMAAAMAAPVTAAFMAAEHGDSVVMLAEATDSFLCTLGRAAADAESELRASYPGICIFGGAGRACTAMAEYRKSYAEAVKASDIAKAEPRFRPVADFSRAGIYQLLLNIPNRGSLEAFYNDVLGKVLEYDRSSGTDLYTTLVNLMSSSFSIGEVAGRMYLHKNTLEYRIKKIESLLGRSLRDTQTAADISVALKIGALLGYGAPRAANGGEKVRTGADEPGAQT